MAETLTIKGFSAAGLCSEWDTLSGTQGMGRKCPQYAAPQGDAAAR